MQRKALFCLLFATLLSCGSDPEPGRRVIVLGFDGMDPNILQRFMDSGHCPNMKKLAETGSFKSLGTSNPPQSPVAWTNFITGMNPGGHGIFDFVHRDPKTYGLLNSGERNEDVDFALSLGGYYMPIIGGTSKNSRYGKPFWDILADEGVPTYIHRMPANFPPTESDAITYTGMNTPDIKPSAGTYSLFSSRFGEDKSRFTRGEFTVVDYNDNRVLTSLIGPAHPLKPEEKPLKTTLTVFTDPERKIAKIEVGDEEVICKLGVLSEWVPVSFDVIPNVLAIDGICRFLIQEMEPDFRMYVSPINIDPFNPVAPVSTPDDASADLAKSIGYYYTQGIPADYSALKEGAFSDADYLQQSNVVLDERKKIFNYALNQCKSGFLYVYFSTSDMTSHNLWRHQDKNHPYHDPTLAPEFENAIRDVYQGLDELVGNLMKDLRSDDTLIIMSDHGFAPFNRAFGVNKWLADKGYLVFNSMEDGSPAKSLYPMTKDDKTSGGANWEKSQAYSVGFNGIYFNLQGREGKGIVPDEDRAALMDRMIAELEGLVDPKTGEAVFLKVWKPEEAYSGRYANDGPDLLLGYRSGYGTSDNAAKGSSDDQFLMDNMSTWSGSHLMDPREVPGVILSNKPILHPDPKLYDVTIGVLEEFGLPKGEGMIGSSIFKPKN